jgi:predicted TPR repeat methyltransferase
MNKLIKKALSKYKQGKHLDAQNYYLKILKKDSHHLDANYLLGTLYAEQGKYNEAVPYLQKAAEIKPSSPGVQCNLGNVCYLQMQYSEAESYFLKALQLDPNLVEAYVGLGGVRESLGKDVDTIYECYQKALAINPNIAAVHQAMGMLLVSDENSDALVHLNKAMQLNPELKGICKDYGFALLMAGRLEESADMFRRAIQQNPDDRRSEYYLCVVEGRDPDDDIRRAYVEGEFDRYAEKFDHKLVEKLGYSIPFQARKMLESVYGKDLHFECAADLGCGTGLSGDMFRDSVDTFIGVDIAEQMIVKAKERNCYDELFKSDISSFLDSTSHSFDLFLATDVVVYLGELDGLMRGIFKRAKAGALFVFSTERSTVDDIELQKTGRYAHSQNYLHSVARKFECSVVAEKYVSVRKESNQWIMGDLVVLKLR